MVIMNIIDNCTIELDNTGQVRYSFNEYQFGKCVDVLVKNINNPTACGNCDGCGYTVDENGSRKDHCKECE